MLSVRPLLDMPLFIEEVTKNVLRISKYIKGVKLWLNDSDIETLFR